MRIDYNPITGILEAGLPSSEYPPTIQDATLFTDMATGACVILADYSAHQVTSNYNNNIITRPTPIIDGILLYGGHAGSEGKIASLRGINYTFNLPILQDYSLKSDLFLGANGIITLTEPTLLNGDRWYVYLGRKVNDYDFIFDPHPPLDLLNPGGWVPPSPYPDPSADKLVLGETMPALTCFRVHSDGKAYPVTADDTVIPFVDGITLQAGSANTEILVGRIKNEIYTTTSNFTTDDIYFLNSLGTITTPRASGLSYSCIIGRSVANSNQLIFDPQMPIKLA